MRGKEREIKYADVMVITTGNRFYKAEATMHPDDSIGLSLFFDNRYSYKVGDNIPIVDILVDPSSMQR